MWKNGCVKIGNTEMYYAAFGKGPEKLAILPGLSDGLVTVKGKALILSAPYRKYLRDYTVYMFSRKNVMPEGYSIRDMAEDQALALRSLGIDRVNLLGVSQGGMIAQYMAIDHPEMVQRLVLAVTAPDANAVAKNTVSAWISMARRGDHRALMTDTAQKMYSEPYFRKYRAFLPLVARLTKPSSCDRFLKNALAILRFDARSELPKISCPTLIIAGSDDRAVGKDAAYRLKEAISDSELFVYEGLGHGAYEEAEDFYDRVFAFLRA